MENPPVQRYLDLPFSESEAIMVILRKSKSTKPGTSLAMPLILISNRIGIHTAIPIPLWNEGKLVFACPLLLLNVMREVCKHRPLHWCCLVSAGCGLDTDVDFNI